MAVHRALPEGWKWSKLEEICSGIFDCPHSTPALTVKGPLVVRSQDIRSGRLKVEEAAHVSEATYIARIRRAEPVLGDLLFSREGTYFGIAAAVPADTQLCLGQRMVLIRPDRNILDFRFLRYWLNSPSAAEEVYARRDGSVAERLNMPVIRSLPVPLPPLPQQRAIAGILGEFDEKIENNRRLNQTLEAMARAIFKSWFVDFDPVREGNSWLSRPGLLGDLAALSKDSLTPADCPDEVFEYYSIPAFDESKSPRFEAGREIRSNKFTVPPGAVLLSKLNPRIPRVWLPRPGGERRSICSTEFLPILPTEQDDDRYYMYSLFCSPGFLDELASKVTGTSGSHQRVTPDDLLRINCKVPEKIARRYYSEVVRPMFDRIASNLEESRTLAALRDALLPKLLSGETRVKQSEKIVGEAV